MEHGEASTEKSIISFNSAQHATQQNCRAGIGAEFYWSIEQTSGCNLMSRSILARCMGEDANRTTSKSILILKEILEYHRREYYS
jgi:hypothetical protein